MNSDINFEIDEKFRRMRQLMMQMPIDNGISHGEFGLMNIIYDNGSDDGITVSQIASALEVTPPAVSRTLKSLDERGLIERRINALNRRSTIVRLTEQGIGILNSAHEGMLKMVAEINRKMGEERVKEFNLLFGEILEIMSDYVNKKEDKSNDQNSEASR